MDDARNQTLETAGDWVSRAESGTLPADQRAELDRWLEDPVNREAFDTVRRTWHLLGALEDSPELEELKATRPPLPVPLEKRRPVWPWAAAAAAVSFLALGLTLWFRFGPTAYETRVGEQTVVELEDGSVVHLDTATRIVATFSRGRREVSLERGRALVDVVKDPARPFVVRSGDVTATALGTQFDVFRRERETDVAVVEGKVHVRRVARPDATAREAELPGADLTRGQMARLVAGAEGIRVEPVDIGSLLLWTTGQIEFDLTPLPEAIEAFNRYSTYEIRLDDPSLASIRVSGRFAVGEFEAFAASLARSAPVQTHRTSDGGIVITSSSKAAAH